MTIVIYSCHSQPLVSHLSVDLMEMPSLTLQPVNTGVFAIVQETLYLMKSLPLAWVSISRSLQMTLYDTVEIVYYIFNLTQ